MCERARDEDDRDQVRERSVADVQGRGERREAVGAQARAARWDTDDAEPRRCLRTGPGLPVSAAVSSWSPRGGAPAPGRPVVAVRRDEEGRHDLAR